VLRTESLSSKCTKLHTVAASNNRDHPTRSLLLSPLASTINCSQALFEVTHRHHSIGITLLLLVCATYLGVILHGHPVCGESHIQRNANREVAVVINPSGLLKDVSPVKCFLYTSCCWPTGIL